MMLDLTADELLSTTRSVRHRLDLDRAVELGVVRQCLELAVQAPTGGSVESWRWLLVRSADTRARIADIYREVTAELFEHRRATATSESSRRAYAGALALADVLDRVPLLVFPCVERRVAAHEPAALSAFYGSIIPAVWSFQLALRSRGLGSTFTTAHLRAAPAVAAVLGIPDTVTQIAMLPVAYTIGTEFKPATRRPVEEVTYLDTWAAAVSADEWC